MRLMYAKPTKKRLGTVSNSLTKSLRMVQANSRGFMGEAASFAPHPSVLIDVDKFINTLITSK